MSQMPGRRNQWVWKSLLLLIGAGIGVRAQAASQTVREIKLEGAGVVRIQLDGVPPKGSVEFDYVRDNVQLSIQNSTIYPAKILHSDSGQEAFNKVFAYQYAPNLVRVRFTVTGKADQFRGKVRLEQKGKLLTIRFPERTETAMENSGKEQSLLAKVLGNSKPEESAAPPAPVSAPEAQAKNIPSEAAEKPVETPVVEAKSKLTGSRSASSSQLGGARPGVSPLRSVFAMFLVVGGLGMVLLYVKSRKKGAQGQKSGDSWWSQVLAGGKKNQSYIEVIASHALGPKQSITVVRIKDQKFVLGVTQDSVQLITQLDADEADLDVLEDPKVADSIGKLFGAKPKSVPATPNSGLLSSAPAIRIPEPAIDLGASFNSLLKSSSGAGAIVARSAYADQQNRSEAPVAPRVQAPKSGGIRNELRKRVQEMGKL